MPVKKRPARTQPYPPKLAGWDPQNTYTLFSTSGESFVKLEAVTIDGAQVAPVAMPRQCHRVQPPWRSDIALITEHFGMTQLPRRGLPCERKYPAIRSFSISCNCCLAVFGFGTQRGATSRLQPQSSLMCACNLAPNGQDWSKQMIRPP